MSDNVEKPKHYTQGKIECITFIEDQGFGEGFNRGNAIKYIVRAGKKDPDKEIEDLEKARVYLTFEIDRLKGLVREKVPSGVFIPSLEPASFPPGHTYCKKCGNHFQSCLCNEDP